MQQLALKTEHCMMNTESKAKYMSVAWFQLKCHVAQVTAKVL
jgi:hypothetical protein